MEFNMKAALGVATRIRTDALHKLREIPDAAKERLNKEMEQLEAKGHQHLLEALEDEAAEFNSTLDLMEELLCVACYHLVEKELTSFLTWCIAPTATDRVSQLKKIRKANSRGTIKLYRKEGVDLARTPGWNDIELLREFANSWKHNGYPTPRLIKRLNLPTSGHSRTSHLADQQIRQAMSQGLPPETETKLPVACAAIKVSGRFLQDVLSRLNIRS